MPETGIWPIIPEESLVADSGTGRVFPTTRTGVKSKRIPLGWEGHDHSNCLPCAITAHASDLTVRVLFSRPRTGATRRRRRPLRRRPLWWRALFWHALQREPRGRALWLAALWVWKALCPACGIRSALHFGFFAPSAVTPVELRHAGPDAIRSADSVNASLVSAAIPNPPQRSSFFRFLSRAPSSRFLLQPSSAVFFLWMLLQRRDPDLLLRTIFAAALLLWCL